MLVFPCILCTLWKGWNSIFQGRNREDETSRALWKNPVKQHFLPYIYLFLCPHLNVGGSNFHFSFTFSHGSVVVSFATLLICYWSINSIHLTRCFWQISVCVYISGCIITNKLILLRMFGLFSWNNTLHFYFSKLAHENYQLVRVMWLTQCGTRWIATLSQLFLQFHYTDTVLKPGSITLGLLVVHFSHDGSAASPLQSSYLPWMCFYSLCWQIQI